MKIYLLRMLMWIGLGLGLLLMPFGRATAGPRKNNYFANQAKVTIKGSEKLVECTKEAPDFHGVSAARGVGVIIGAFDHFVIEANENVIDYVIVEVSNGNLTISIDDTVNVRNAHVIVSIPNNGHIDAIHVSSGASVKTQQALQAGDMTLRLASGATLDAALKAERCQIHLASGSEMRCVADLSACSIHASSAAELNASLKTKTLTAILSSGAEINLSGSGETLEAQLSSGSELNASNFEISRTARVQASSGAEAMVNCAEELTASASSGADICYTGDCHVNARKSSGGSIKKR